GCSFVPGLCSGPVWVARIPARHRIPGDCSRRITSGPVSVPDSMLGGVNLDLEALAAAANAIAGSVVSWEMAVRIGQSLEITDALWELVPVVAAAGERVDERPAAQAADLSPAAAGLDDASRTRIRSLGDEFTGVLDEAVAAQLANTDESALASLTPAEVMADPFGTFGALIDLPAYMQQVLPATAELASLSSREMLYLAAYLRQALPTP